MAHCSYNKRYNPTVSSFCHNIYQKMYWKIIVMFALICIGQCQDVRLNVSESISHISKTKTIADAVNNFGYNLLLTAMKQNEDKNVVISPTSVAGLLAMTLLGSVGKTYEELATVLGFSQDILENRYNHESFGEMLKYLNRDEYGSKTIYADAIYVDEQRPLRELYRTYMTRVYGGEITNVDFRNDEQVKQIINEWVSDHTMGKITNFLQSPLPRATKVVLLSALYFSGQWERPFKPEYTQEMPFETPTGEVLVQQMLHSGQFKYVHSKKFDMHMISFPYNDSATTMYVMKPRVPQRQTLTSLMSRLNSDEIDNLISQMAKSTAVVRFPKLELSSKTYLEDSLKALGVRALFSPSDANLALMMNANKNTTVQISSRIRDPRLSQALDRLSNPGVYVDSVLHDVKLTINEFGTEAVAATSGILARSAKLFYADTPYAMFIRHDKTKLITFSAAIFDPSN